MDDLKSIKVYKFDDTEKSWHEFALKFRVVADSRGYEEIIDGTKSLPDKKENWTYLKKIMQIRRRQKWKSWQPEWPTKWVMETW